MFRFFDGKEKNNKTEEFVYKGEERNFEYEVVPIMTQEYTTWMPGYITLELHITENNKAYIHKRLFSYRITHGSVDKFEDFQHEYNKYIKMKQKDWDELVLKEIKNKLKHEYEVDLSGRNLKEMIDKLTIKGIVKIK